MRDVAPERVFAELKRIVIAPEAVRGLRELDRVGATPVVLPELDALRGIEQSAYHHLDVYDHTLAVLEEAIAIERDPEPVFREQASAVAALLGEPLADGLSRAGALRFGALLHDAAKPQTRGITAEGRITFIGHDRAGSSLSRDILSRLRASERLRAHVAALTLNHLRLGFLVHRRPSPARDLRLPDRMRAGGGRRDRALGGRPAGHPRAQGRRGDRQARGPRAPVFAEALAFERDPPAPLVRGDDLAAGLGIEPGPEVGRLLAEVAEAQFAGELRTRDEALRFVRRLARCS